MSCCACAPAEMHQRWTLYTGFSEFVKKEKNKKNGSEFGQCSTAAASSQFYRRRFARRDAEEKP
jgi:hypothetical protein